MREARERSAAERAVFLDGTCAEEVALRQRLEALIAAHEQLETLLATQAEAARPAIKLDLADAPDEAVGRTLGRYKLLERVGEGGCGVVYVDAWGGPAQAAEWKQKLAAFQRANKAAEKKAPQP